MQILNTDNTVILSQVTGDISINNSTASVLDADILFTGTADDVKDYKSIGINVIASHASATDGLTVQFSSDGTNWDKIHSFTIPAATAKFFNIPVESRYFRIVYTNGGTLQTYFRLQTIYHATLTKESTLRLSEAIDAETAAQLNRSVITGLDIGSGLFKNVSSYDTGLANGLIVISTDVLGTVILNPASAFATNGGSGLAILPSAGVGKKNRVFKATFTVDAAGTLTISDGFGAFYLPANGNITIDFGTIGMVQTTAATAITATNSGGGNVSAHGAYRTE